MPKNKRPVPRKSATAVEEDAEVQAQALAELALDLAEGEQDEDEEGGVAPQAADAAALALKQENFSKLLRNALRKKNDEVLYGALERALYDDVEAYRLLRTRIEDMAGAVVLRREGAPSMEANAFAIPVFVRSTGSLNPKDDFADSDAFADLVASFTSAGLESPQAKVVMMSHAYDLDEFDAITFSHLNEMVREAAASMTEKKLVARPALERSIGGWQGAQFAADDNVVVLRFLLGFALKREDDPFYQVPADEAAADVYFEARLERYRLWTAQVAPLVKRCMSSQPASLEVHFLYQDLFYGAKEGGIAELATMRMLAEVDAALAGAGLTAEQVQAVVGPVELEGELAIRTVLSGSSDGRAVSTIDKLCAPAAEIADDIDEVCDALLGQGLGAVSVALGFNADGTPEQATPYANS